MDWNMSVCCLARGIKKGTLKASFDYVQRVYRESCDRSSGEAGNGLNQRGRETRMVVIHERRNGGVGTIIL